MPLRSERLDPSCEKAPGDVRRFLREAERRIDRFSRSHHIPAFVACDFSRVWAALSFLEASDLPSGRWFCEWGSGFGVVSCLASLLGFDAWGIEAEEELVDAARRLAGDFELPVEFAGGSFVPKESDGELARGGEHAWLNTACRSGYEIMGLDLDEFDLVFVYPWPDEEELVEDLFERHAGIGALLLSYHGGEDVRLSRKVG